jgi:hypothetical protein
MRLLCLSFLMLSFGCATIVRSNQHDVTIYGPEGLQAYDGAQQIELTPKSREGAQVKYVAQVDRHTEKLTLRSPTRTTVTTLDTHTSAGWVILDFLLIWPVSITVDYLSQAWKSFDDITFLATGPSTSVAVAEPARAPPPPAPVALKAQPASSRSLVERGKLAVLDFQNSAKDLTTDNVRYFADVVRGATLKSAPQVEVITRENLLVLLQATGKDAAQCEGECEVDTGRRIGADDVISGEVLKVGSRYKISLKLHETRDGRLLSTSVASGKTIDELDENLQSAASDLFAPR